MHRTLIATLTVAAMIPYSVLAAPVFACGGAAFAGGAQLLCSHLDPKAPLQNCSFSWALRTTDETPSVVQGTFVLAPGSSNSVVYQGFGFDSELSNPIVICQGSPG